MGLVQVQIVVDGQQVQVFFYVEQVEICVVFECSLFDLVVVLCDMGFMFSGGGVFQVVSGGSNSSGGGVFQQLVCDGGVGFVVGSSRIQCVSGIDDGMLVISCVGGVCGGFVCGVVDLYV